MRRTICVLVATLLCSPVSAHHSAAMFDRDRAAELQGTVKSWEWTNPHCWLQVMVERAGAKPVQYNIESAAVNLLIRRGWTPKSLQPGDRISFRYHPLRDGNNGGELVSVVKSDGTRFVVQAPGAQ